MVRTADFQSANTGSIPVCAIIYLTRAKFYAKLPIMTKARKWKVGDRCRVNRYGEWRNGTIVALAYNGEVAIVVRDGETAERHYLTARLIKAVENA